MVTGVGGGGHGEQILKALRLADTDYEITATDMARESSGLVHADRAAIVPSANDPSYVSVLVELCIERGVKVVFTDPSPSSSG